MVLKNLGAVRPLDLLAASRQEQHSCPPPPCSPLPVSLSPQTSGGSYTPGRASLKGRRLVSRRGGARGVQEGWRREPLRSQEGEALVQPTLEIVTRPHDCNLQSVM